jgi:hypothetical protein
MQTGEVEADAGVTLVERGRVIRAGVTEGRFGSGDDALRFHVGPERTRIVRRWGPMGDPLCVGRTQLVALAAGMQDWRTLRCRWWSFREDASGSVAGYGGRRQEVRAPGDTPVAVVGRVFPGGRLEGLQLSGQEDSVELLVPALVGDGAARREGLVWRGEAPEAVAAALALASRLRRGCPEPETGLPYAPGQRYRMRAPRVGPAAKALAAAGLPVGIRYACAGLQLEALRHEARILDAEGRALVLYPHEAPLLGLLARLRV